MESKARTILDARRFGQANLRIFNVIPAPHFREVAEQDRSRLRWRRLWHSNRGWQDDVQPTQDRVASRFRRGPREGVLPVTGSESAKSSGGLDRSVREQFLVPVPEKPVTALAVGALKYLRVLDLHLLPSAPYLGSAGWRHTRQKARKMIQQELMAMKCSLTFRLSKACAFRRNRSRFPPQHPHQ